jgi:hypothetical protein
MELNERILKIIDTYENGSKSQFAVKTGMHNQAYKLLRHGYKPLKNTIDRIIYAYPDISVEWLTSGIGDMITVRPAVERQEEKTDKFPLTELPGHLTAHQVLSRIMEYIGIDSLPKFSVKLNVSLKYLSQVYNGTQPMGSKLAQIIHKAFPEIPYQWIKTGDNLSGKPQSSSPVEDPGNPQIQSPVQDPTSDQTPELTDDKAEIRTLELQKLKERILKIVDTCENGSKSRFAAKTGMRTQIYNLLEPGYQPRKATIDHIISGYPDISAEWLTSGIGDMTVVRPAAGNKEKEISYPRVETGENLSGKSQSSPQKEDTDNPQIQSPVQDPASDQTRELQERILKVIDTCENGSKYHFSLKTRLQSQIYRLLKPGHKPDKVNIDRIISAYPNISAEWLTSGVGDMTAARPAAGNREEKTSCPQVKTGENPSVKSQSSPQKQDAVNLQIQRPIDHLEKAVQDLTPVQKNLKSIDDKSYIQALESQIQTILKTNMGLLSDYQKAIEINQQLNNTVIELTEKLVDL